MDKIAKSLQKFSPQEKKYVKEILTKLNNNYLSGLEVKKLKGYDNIFRIRKGKLRVIYRVSKNHSIFVLAVERRSDTTYKF